MKVPVTRLSTARVTKEPDIQQNEEKEHASLMRDFRTKSSRKVGFVTTNLIESLTDISNKNGFYYFPLKTY